MAYEEIDIKPKEDNECDGWYKRLLLRLFSHNTAESIYCLTIDFIAFLAKIGLILTLPFKFIQFFIESWKERNQQKKLK